MIDLNLTLDEVFDNWEEDWFFTIWMDQGWLPSYFITFLGDPDTPERISGALITHYDEEIEARYGSRKISKRFARMCTKDGANYMEINNGYGLFSMVLNKYNTKWKRLYEAMFAEYNPIDNYNMTEDENAQTQIHTESSQNVKTYGFDSSEPVPTGEGSAGSDTTGDYDKNRRKLTRKGNIGVTTTQTMIEQEIELRKHDFMDIVINDIGEFLTRPQY